ncbi:MAG: tRNA (N6-threonylcarbamoyladenosine(37)-N6)-methyltransferase TrmO [Akkermansiaceae bacterium]
MQFDIIGHVNTCYEEKFGIPRQPGLVDEAWGTLTFEPSFNNVDCVRGLDNFSHLWLIFIFHQAIRDHWKPTVRPPRLGGNDKTGVFASRSPFRPNPVGLSCVRLDRIELNSSNSPVLHLRGVDLVNATPIIDIKPYIPYADSLPDARGGFAHKAPSYLKVKWADNITNTLENNTKRLIEKSLAIDPRPAYQQDNQQREYGCLIAGHNIRWVVRDNTILILTCSPYEPA